jgi:hypothetical protein
VNRKPVGSDDGSLALFTVIVVVVAAGPPPPPPLPPHPNVKLRTQRRPRPNAARYFFLPGRKSRNIAARPVPALSIHQPLPPNDGATPAAWSMGSASAVEAVRVVDGAATATVNCPVAAAALVTLIASGFGEHVTPAGNPAAGQVTFTVPVNPPVGVTVMVDT